MPGTTEKHKGESKGPNNESEAEAEPQHEKNKFRGLEQYSIDMLLLFPLALAATIGVLSLT